MPEVWLVEYSADDYHEVVKACTTKELAKREKHKIGQNLPPWRHMDDYEIVKYEVVWE